MSILQIILIFLVMLVLAYIALRLYKYYTTRSDIGYQVEKLIDKQHKGNQYIMVDKSRIPLSAQGNEYSISFWLFIKDYNYRYGSNKTILYRGDKENEESNPYIFLSPKNNDLNIKVQLQTNTVKDSPNVNNVETFNSTTLPYDYFNNKTSNISGNLVSEKFSDPPMGSNTTPAPVGTESSPGPAVVGDVNSRLERIELQMQKLIGMKDDPTSTSTPDGSGNIDDSLGNDKNNTPIMYDECVVNDIPIQKWTHVVVSIFNNSLEIYIDGRLHKTCSLRGFPKPNLQNMHVCANGGFDGFISNLEYSNMTLSPDKIYNKYVMGPELNAGFFESVGNFFKRLFSVFDS